MTTAEVAQGTAADWKTPRPCRICTRDFTPQRRKQVYCSRECRNVAINQQRPAVRITAEEFYALERYVFWHGACHQAECSCDDTCECTGRPINAGVNTLVLKIREHFKASEALASTGNSDSPEATTRTAPPK